MFKKILKAFDQLLKPSQKRENNHNKAIMPKSSNKIELEHISPNALEVIRRLNNAGYTAYLVGGCIRDLLLSIHPKDFDVVTDATPEQIRKTFRNSRIIGRRFRLVHVFWGREIIEVATFRGPHSNDEAESNASLNKKGRIIRDNVYGSIEEDAKRRDFTINALYLDVNKGKVLDYVNGLQDIEMRTIRIIGNSPSKRYQEDPVRMLRAVRFAAKLNFKIEASSEKQIYQLSHLLKDIPAARLFDEVIKLFIARNTVETFQLLRKYRLLDALFPALVTTLDKTPEAEAFIIQALSNTDTRLTQGKTINPAFVYATLLWPVLLDELGTTLADYTFDLPTLQDKAQEIITQQNQYTSIPKRFSIPTREIWEAQVRLTRRQGKKADILLQHPRFRAAYDFLLLRESTCPPKESLAKWWEQYQMADDPAKRLMIRQLNSTDNKKHSRRKRYYRPKKSTSESNQHD